MVFEMWFRKGFSIFVAAGIFAALSCPYVISTADSNVRWNSAQSYYAPQLRDKRALSDKDEGFLDFGFAVEPKSVVVGKDESARLDCQTYGVQSSEIRIEWRKDGNRLSPGGSGGSLTLLSNGSLVVNKATPSIKGGEGGDEGFYQCVAIVETGLNTWTYISKKATLRLATLPRFEQQPSNREVNAGDTVVFPCRVSAVPAPDVRWYKDNAQLLPGDDPRLTIFPLTGTLEIRNVQGADQGNYKCKLSNKDKYRESSEGVLTVVRLKFLPKPFSPKFEVEPRSQVLKEGDTAVLECAANGFPEVQMKWLKDQTALSMGGRMRKEGTGTLVIEKVGPADTGTYTCRASNSDDSVDTGAALKVQVGPTLSVVPKNIVSKETNDVEFECKAEGEPGPAVTWYKNAEVIIPSEYFVIEKTKLKVLGLVKTDSGVYQCLAENGAGSVQSSAQLVVQMADGTNGTGTPHPHSPAELPESPEGGEGQPLPAPTEPLGLTTTTRGSRSVSLRWDPPLQTYGTLKAYSIFYKEDGSARERVVNSTGSERNVLIKGLQPSTVYFFRVVAFNQNSHGLSSAPLKVQTEHERAVPGRVQNLKVVVLSPESVHLSWDPPGSESLPPKSYKIFYALTSLIDEDKSNSNNGKETEIQLGNAVEYPLHGLDKFTSYTFRIEAIGENGAGLPSERIKVKTFSDVPSAPPSEINAEPASAQTIVVEWEPPPPGDQNGIINGYKLRYRKKKRGSQGKAFATDGSVRETTITGLDAGTQYQVRVAAMTVNGTGPASNWFYVTTYDKDREEEQVPGPPTTLKVQERSHSIMLTWTPPLDDGVMIRGYLIGWGINVPDISSRKVDATKRRFTIEGLRPGRDYVVSLKAYNKIGNGFPIYETVRTLEEGALLPGTQGGVSPQIDIPYHVRALAESAHSIRISWDDRGAKARPPTDGRMYTIKFSSHYEHGGRERYVNSTRTTYILDQLNPNRKYEIQVRTVIRGKYSKWSMIVWNTTFTAAPSSAPRDLTAVPSNDKGPRTIRLNWQPPKHSNGPITEYLIFYTREPSQIDSRWDFKSVQGDTMTAEIPDLLPETVYFFKIQATSTKGYGPFSAVIQHRTPGYGSGGGDGGGGVGGSSQDVKEGTSQLIIIIIAVVGVLVVLILIGLLIYCCCPCCSRRNRHGYLPGKKSTAAKAEVKPPPDLWIHHDHLRRGSNDHQASPNGSMQDMKQYSMTMRQPSPPPLDEPPRYHALADNKGSSSVMSRSVDHLGLQNRQGTMERRVGRAKPIIAVRHAGSSTAGSENEGSLEGPMSARQRTPQVVYTGPRQAYPAKTTVEFDPGHHSPYGSGTLGAPGLTPTPPPQLPNGGPPFGPPPGATPPVGVADANGRRSGNPLQSFANAAAPPPTHPPPGGTSTPPRTHVVRPVPITVVASPHRSVGTSATGKPAGIVIGTKAVLASRSPRPPIHNHSLSDANPYSSGKETDNELQHSYSTEELNVQMENLDTLMEDLHAMSQNEFNVV